MPSSQEEDKTLAPYFVVKGDPSVDQLPLKDTRVEISVSGVIADVKVRQIYRNEGSRPINASYVFPASTRAAVYAMRMQIGNEIIVAKIKEREQAKKDFEQAKEEGKSASLLEQQRPNVFSMSLANIMPQEQVEIELVTPSCWSRLTTFTNSCFRLLLDHATHRHQDDNEERDDKFVADALFASGSTAAQCFAHLDADLRRCADLRSGVPVAPDHAAMAEPGCGAIDARRFGSIPGKSRLRSSLSSRRRSDRFRPAAIPG